MTEPTLQALIDAAEAYETLMVPALFAEWAAKVADAAKLRPDHKVLDVACGTGALAREVASRVGSGGVVAGLDANPGMLEVARRVTPALRWQQGIAESLPFPDQSFDAVVSQFGLMFFRDRAQALREALRVLTPEGRLTFAVWDSVQNIPAWDAEIELLDRSAGRRAADALRAPFVLGEPEDLAATFREAGIASVEITTEKAIARFPSIRVVVEADLRGWLPVMGVVLPEEQITEILEEAEHVLAPYVSTGGTAVFDTSAHIITGARM